MRKSRWCQEEKDAVDTVKTLRRKTITSALIVLSIFQIAVFTLSKTIYMSEKKYNPTNSKWIYEIVAHFLASHLNSLTFFVNLFVFRLLMT